MNLIFRSGSCLAGPGRGWLRRGDMWRAAAAAAAQAAPDTGDTARGRAGSTLKILQMSLIVDVVTFEGLMPSGGVTLAGLGSKSNENVWNRAEGPRGVTITIYV